MFKLRRPRMLARPAALSSIDGGALAHVVGGRITPRTGLDPAIAQQLTTLAKTVSEVGQVLEVNKQQKQAQLSQVMQQMMQSRGA